ncbi:MAG: 16S rRNA (cytosine(1402)-N(4))-methyltransferase RsmH [bacterium]
MYSHIPVMLNEVIELLNPQPGQNFVDCTLGGGGHALEILKRVAPNGKVLGIDLDEKAIEEVKSKMKTSPDPSLSRRGSLVNDNFANLGKILEEQKFGPVHGILLDLGISSAEYESGRGFSFQKDEPLDMRFGVTSPLPPPQRRWKTAEDIVNNWPRENLIKIFKEYGEERLAVKIADKIVKARADVKIETTKQLADLVFSEYKKAYKNKTFKIHPATKVFQALRIAVNDELENLEKVLPQAIGALEKGGRLAVISFHSLEDRIVKQFFAKQSKGCICPPEFPICQCGHKPLLKIITKKPITALEDEIERNPRSRSAKLRVAEKI